MLLGRCSQGFVLPVLEYCSAMWCSSADKHLKLLDRVVSGASFLTGGVLECDIAHRRPVAVLCMLYKFRCNPMHPLYSALPVSYLVMPKKTFCFAPCFFFCKKKTFFFRCFRFFCLFFKLIYLLKKYILSSLLNHVKGLFNY